jgi:hypothetical protein
MRGPGTRRGFPQRVGAHEEKAVMRIMRDRRPFAVLAIAGALTLAACDDDPTGVDEHHEPEGVQLVLNGVTVATYDAGAWTGGLEVNAGEETAHIDVQFLDDEGDPIALDDDVYLEVEVADETIAEFEQDTPGEFGGHLHGVSAGTTTVVFRLMHGAIGSGHADFVTTPGVTATVN